MLHHVRMTKQGYNACLVDHPSGQLLVSRRGFHRARPDVFGLGTSSDTQPLRQLSTLEPVLDQGWEDPGFAGIDKNGNIILVVTDAEFGSRKHDQKMAVLWITEDGKLLDHWRIEEVTGLPCLRKWDKNRVPIRNSILL